MTRKDFLWVIFAFALFAGAVGFVFLPPATVLPMVIGYALICLSVLVMLGGLVFATAILIGGWK